MKKIIAFALAACLCLALAVTASAEGSVYYQMCIRDSRSTAPESSSVGTESA